MTIGHLTNISSLENVCSFPCSFLVESLDFFVVEFCEYIVDHGYLFFI